MTCKEADTKLIIFVLIFVFTIGVMVRFFNEIKVEDEPARINYIPIATWTRSVSVGTPSISTTTTL